MSVIIAVIVCLAVIALLLVVGGKKSGGAKKGRGGSGSRSKNRAQIIRDATKKLSHDPHNIPALLALGELYYNEHLWDKAINIYNELANLAAGHHEIDPAMVYLRHGICCLKLKRSQDALKIRSELLFGKSVLRKQ